jgi:hypothetical protein
MSQHRVPATGYHSSGTAGWWMDVDSTAGVVKRIVGVVWGLKEENILAGGGRGGLDRRFGYSLMRLRIRRWNRRLDSRVHGWEVPGLHDHGNRHYDNHGHGNRDHGNLGARGLARARTLNRKILVVIVGLGARIGGGKVLRHWYWVALALFHLLLTT